MIQFQTIDGVVSRYQRVRANSVPSTSLLSVTLTGSNKSRLVDYINKSVEVLAIEQWKDKTNYARQTLKFIEEQFQDAKDPISRNGQCGSRSKFGAERRQP